MQIEFHQLELTYRKLRRGDAKRQAKLLASLSEHGQQSPVMVVKQDGGTGRYVLIDGYQRVAALRRLGHDTVEALLLPLCEVAALCLRHQLEETQQRSVLEQGWLLAELLERHGVSQAKLAQLLGHSESWVSRRLALVRELPEQAQDLVRRGRLCPCQGSGGQILSSSADRIRGRRTAASGEASWHGSRLVRQIGSSGKAAVMAGRGGFGRPTQGRISWRS